MIHDPSDSNNARASAQVLKFRLRRKEAGGLPRARAPAIAPGDRANHLIDDLARYEQEDQQVDHRRRMTMNVIAVIIVAFLVGAGVWIADTISDMQKAQDCVMQGRQNCAPIQVPSARH